VSFTHRYTARPEPAVRNVPADDVAVVMTVAPDALAPPLAAAAPLAGTLLAAAPLAGALLAGAGAAVLLPPLLHAATSSAAATVPPIPAATRAGAGIRLSWKFLIVLVSRPARSVAPVPLPLSVCRINYGWKHGMDWTLAYGRAAARTFRRARRHFPSISYGQTTP
jgi:hypothetical protein